MGWQIGVPCNNFLIFCQLYTGMHKMTGRPTFRTNLVIACWSGPRRHEHDPDAAAKAPYVDSGLSYLRKQAGTLSKYKHSLTQITLVVAHDPDCPESYKQFVENEFPGRIGNAFVAKHFREDNKGISYGSWLYGARLYTEFDYFIFIEDDYCFVRNHFDKKMIKMYNPNKCDYMCAYRNNDLYVTNGFISHQKLAQKKWDWPIADLQEDVYSSGDMRLFVDAFQVCMFKPPYTAAPFFGHHIEPGVIVFGAGDFLLAPTQIIDPETFEAKLPGTVNHYE